MSLVKKFATVASGTLASRILGFTREMLMAAALGTGPVADAFYAAFQFPNTFRRLFAEGAFNTAFVPLFAKEIEADGMEGAKRFSEEVFGVLFSVLIVLTIVMELAMPLLVRTIIAPGFTDEPAKYALTVSLATIMFPYLVCMSLASMMAGMLNSLRRYFAAAIAPVFLNVILIGVLYWAWRKGADGLAVGHWMAWGVMAAGVVQLVAHVVAEQQAEVAAGTGFGDPRPQALARRPRLQAQDQQEPFVQGQPRTHRVQPLRRQAAQAIQTLAHFIEGAGQIADHIGTIGFHFAGNIAGGDALDGGHEAANGLENAANDEPCHRNQQEKQRSAYLPGHFHHGDRTVIHAIGRDAHADVADRVTGAIHQGRDTLQMRAPARINHFDRRADRRQMNDIQGGRR